MNIKKEYMAGCRALEKQEIINLLSLLKNPRDRALVVLGIRSGFRISELLSLKVPDVYRFGRVVDVVRVTARYMKGKERSREVPLHEDARQAIAELLRTYTENYDGFLFKSSQREAAIDRRQANRILRESFNALELQGKLASHSLRKTFAKTVHRGFKGDIRKTMRALGHKSINSTDRYLEVDQGEIYSVILKAK